jgi:hypothetical protein
VAAAIFAAGGVGFAAGRVTASASAWPPPAVAGSRASSDRQRGQAATASLNGQGQGGPEAFGAGGGITISGVTAVMDQHAQARIGPDDHGRAQRLDGVSQPGLATASVDQAAPSGRSVAVAATVAAATATAGQGGQGGGFTLGAATNVTVVPK